MSTVPNHLFNIQVDGVFRQNFISEWHTRLCTILCYLILLYQGVYVLHMITQMWIHGYEISITYINVIQHTASIINPDVAYNEKAILTRQK